MPDFWQRSARRFAAWMPSLSLSRAMATRLAAEAGKAPTPAAERAAAPAAPG